MSDGCKAKKCATFVVWSAWEYLNDVFLFLPAGYDDISNCIDLIICLGGDGTLLYASSLFQVITLSFVFWSSQLSDLLSFIASSLLLFYCYGDYYNVGFDDHYKDLIE